MSARFGVYGLAVMGQNLARNIASRGIPVAVYNRTASRIELFMTEHGSNGQFLPTYDVKELVAALERPRSILLMVKAGEAVDHVERELHRGDGAVEGAQRGRDDVDARGGAGRHADRPPAPDGRPV